MEKYLLIPVKGDPKIVELDETILLHEFQTLVQGHIETVPFPRSKELIMIVNEEGLINDMLFNQRASQLLNHSLFGPAVVAGIGLRDGEPDMVGLSEHMCNTLQMLMGIQDGMAKRNKKSP